MDATQSFTQRVVAELAPHTPLLPCCRLSLVEGLALVTTTPEAIATTRPVAVRAAMQALHAEHFPAHVSRVGAARRTQYVLVGVDPAVVHVRSARVCCARSRLRGAFLGAGRLVRPDGEPYLEIGCAAEDGARQLTIDFTSLGVGARVRRRRGRWVVTVRSGAAVGAALSSIGAQAGRLAFESGRVIREVRSGVNRRLNAETANLRRTAAAGVRQMESIAVLEADPARWLALPPALREAAALRARHPDDDLGQLAERAGCSRPAMAGRLQRLVAAAGEGGDRVRPQG
ncbi:MAG TPA: DNA-binding protein WhiA [Candidatus Saccharimonadales bacterium]|nr:DNA-binding protein WhiA [Candidatus Saccharimonadales bacterium]